MWPRRLIAGIDCSIRAAPVVIRIRFHSSKASALVSRNLPSRQSASKAVGSPAHEQLQPPVLLPSTAANYIFETLKQSKTQDEMKSQGMQIPGLTLLNNLAPHAIAPTSEGGFISAAAPRSQVTTTVQPRRKENKKAKARRALAEAQAAANHNGYHAQPPNQYGQRLLNPLCLLELQGTDKLLLNRPYNFNNFNNNNIVIRTPPTGPRIPARDSPRDERVAPSRASGGIPDPTPSYISQSFALSSSLRQPRRIFVIMDLNGTLLYRPNKRNPFNFIQRPHARQFLDYCIDTFHVAIWSSARPENVDKMVSQLLSPQQRAKCVVIWARDKFGLSPGDYSSRVQCYKRLGAIWNDPQVRASHPAAAHGQRWDQTNTVLVDDSAEKGRSEPYNILQLPEFEGLRDEPPDVLPQVHDYLNALCYQTNISGYIRDHPFKIDASYRLTPSQDVDMR
ncbi:phospho phosphatase [Trichoderma arundinaceum]|uniref:Mitochondrial import inner membrane translocase subunit TIM50 n=1 Tax=Trichoderma arundinaceum TaxID=490622 RepID=A0A395NUY2_TRIAR|nr:phospho phosphatase [Trichoderma arundinaceum]